MPNASNLQTSFTGGEVSPLAQGRSDQPWYRQAMSLSLNGVSLEEGGWTRRGGFELIVPARGRTYCNLLPFDGSPTCSFAMAFTNDNLQFVTQSSLIFDNTVCTIASSTGTVGEVVLVAEPSETWVAGNQVMIAFPDASSADYPYSQALEANLRGRLLTLGVVIDQTHMVLYDDLGSTLNVNWSEGVLVGAQIMRVLNLTTVYSGVETLQNLRSIQIEEQAVILSAGTAPQVVQITDGFSMSADPTFTITALSMVDGPYLDAFENDGATISGYSGSITFTDSHASYTFVAGDVGRSIRIFTQPPAWAGGTAYTVGENVTDVSGAWWTAIINNTGVTPGQVTTVSGVQQLAWAPAPQAGTWAWGKITAVAGGGASCTVLLDATIPGMALISANGETVAMWMLGVYTGSTYPVCGMYTSGRLVLAGAVPNRFDTTISNGVVNGVATFSPTDPYDNVLDDSGISEVLNSRFLTQIQWMHPNDSGWLMGSLACEFLVFSSETNDPITPTNIDSRQLTNEGCAFVEPVAAGIGLMFVQKFGRRVVEYLADAFSGKFSGRTLNEWAKHLTTSGVARLAYQNEPFPCVWAIMNNGLLAGCTYRRFSRFVNQPPDIQAWHRHVHGRQRLFTSMCVVPGKSGLLDRLFTVTNDPTISPGLGAVENYAIEIMQPIGQENTTALGGWYCDEAPGTGPGYSGTDCGGGNAFTFAPTGGTIGTDSTTPNVDNLAPYSNGGASPAVGQPLSGALDALEASYLDGSTALYILAPAESDTAQLSLSVWVASEDFPQQAGSLFASPALSVAEATASPRSAKQSVSEILAKGSAGTMDSGATPTLLAASSSGIDGAFVEGGHGGYVDDGSSLVSGQVWNHVMVSMKSNGNGTITVTSAVNETVLASSVTVGELDSEKDAWPFATQPGAVKDGNTCVWCIGGQEVVSGDFSISYNFGPATPKPLVIPTLAQIVQSLFSAIPISEQGLPPWYNVGPRSNITFGGAPLPALGAYLSYIQNLQDQQATQQNLTATSVTVTGGQTNLPQPDGLGGYTGYRGSLAELLIWPGSFIDWTSSTNRAYLHFYDTNVDLYRPLSVGPQGAGTALGTPYVYLSGPPPNFNLNRANGKRLTVVGTGVIASPLNPP